MSSVWYNLPLAGYIKQLTFKHISDELSRIRSEELTMDQAELLVSQERVRRTEKYEWVCCVPECPMASLRRYEAPGKKHTYEVHDTVNVKPNSLTVKNFVWEAMSKSVSHCITRRGQPCESIACEACKGNYRTSIVSVLIH